jgi:hypothetical protein
MTKTPRVLFDTGQSTKSIGTTNLRNSVQFVKFVFFSCTTRDLRSQIGT